MTHSNRPLFLMASVVVLVLWLVIPYMTPPLIVIPKSYDVSLHVLELALAGLILFWVISDGRRTLRRKEREYNALISICREPVFIRRHDKIIAVNQASLDLFGAHDKSQVIGRSILDFDHPESRNTTKNRIGDIELSTEAADGKLVTLNGEIKNVEGFGFPLSFGRESTILVILKDVTAAKQAEHRLQKTADLFHLIHTHLPEMIVCLDLSGEIKYESPSHVAYRRKYSSPPISNSLKDLVHPSDLNRMQDLYRAIIEDHRPLEIDIRVKNGHNTWGHLEVLGTPVVDTATDSVQAVVLVSRDVTQRKEAESSLRRTEKLAVAGQLAAGLAHEIRNPLTIIKGLLQLMEISELKASHAELILNQLNHMESIINELLMYSKPTTIKQRELDVCETLENAILLISTQAALRSVELKTYFPSEPMFVNCNADHLRQVWVNLIRNAVESMHSGGDVLIVVKKVGEFVQVTVADQGEGIPKRIINRLGEPFLTTKLGGVGLGLMVTQRIVHQHGGTIEFDSKPSAGTEVTVRLPLSLTKGSAV